MSCLKLERSRFSATARRGRDHRTESFSAGRPRRITGVVRFLLLTAGSHGMSHELDQHRDKDISAVSSDADGQVRWMLCCERSCRQARSGRGGTSCETRLLLEILRLLQAIQRVQSPCVWTDRPTSSHSHARRWLARSPSGPCMGVSLALLAARDRQPTVSISPKAPAATLPSCSQRCMRPCTMRTARATLRLACAGAVKGVR